MNILSTLQYESLKEFKIEPQNKILKYDGRPFFCDELKEEIKRKLK